MTACLHLYSSLYVGPWVGFMLTELREQAASMNPEQIFTKEVIYAQIYA